MDNSQKKHNGIRWQPLLIVSVLHAAANASLIATLESSPMQQAKSLNLITVVLPGSGC
jgi:hypothetical protein